MDAWYWYVCHGLEQYLYVLAYYVSYGWNIRFKEKYASRKKKPVSKKKSSSSLTERTVGRPKVQQKTARDYVLAMLDKELEQKKGVSV